MAINVKTYLLKDVPASLTQVFSVTNPTTVKGIIVSANGENDEKITITIRRSGTDYYIARKVRVSNKDDVPFTFSGHINLEDSGDAIFAEAENASRLDITVSAWEHA